MAKLVIRNSAGTVQFSTNFKNVCLAAKGTITTWSTWSSEGITLRLFSVSYTAAGTNRPLCGVPGGAFFGVTNSGSVYTFSFLAPTSVSSLDYYIFDQLPILPAAAGMNLRNAANELIYSSDYKPLRIRAIIGGSCQVDTDPWITSPGGRITDESFTYESGRSYLPIITRPSFVKAYFYIGAGNYRLSTWIVSAGVSGATITQSMRRYSAESATTTSPSSAAQRFVLSRGIIVADVTNY